MSLSSPRLVAAPRSLPQRGFGVGQMSRANGFPIGGRGRDATSRNRARGRVMLDVSPDEAMVAWSRFVASVCRDREDCRAVFGVTFQTACNWYDAASRPQLDKVMKAYRAYPDAFERFMGGMW